MTEIEAFESMYGKTYLRTKKPREYAIVWEAWQAACKWQREKDADICEAAPIDGAFLLRDIIREQAVNEQN